MLLSSNGSAVLAEALGGVAFFWWLYNLTNSPWALVAVSMVRAVVSTLASPVAGVLADHYSRSKVMFLSSAVRASTAALLALLVWLKLANPVVIVAVIALLQLCSAVFLPSVQAIVPQFARGHRLTQVNSIVQTSQAVAQVVGPLLGGLVVSTVGLGGASVVLGIIYLVSALTAINHDSEAGEQNRQVGNSFGGLTGFLKRMAEVFPYLRSTPLVSLLMGFTVILNLLVIPVFIVLPVLTRDVLGLTAMHYGGLGAAIPGGLLLGSLLTAWIRLEGRKASIAMMSILLVGAAYASLGLAQNFVTTFLAVLIMGVGMAVSSVVGKVILQETVPRDRLGRVFGLMLGLTSAAQPLGLAVTGAVMASSGPGIVALSFGGFTAVAAVVSFVMLTIRRV